MAGYFTEQALNFLKDLQTRADDVAAEVSKDVGKRADEYAMRIMIPVARAEIRGRYLEAANKWYDAYSPKKYRRTYGLRDVLKLTDPGSDGVGWMTEGSIVKPSWNGGSYDIYASVFEGGAHGGPVHGHPPTYSTPIPKLFGLFDESSEQYQEVYEYLQQLVEETGQDYFAEHFPEEFEKRFSI